MSVSLFVGVRVGVNVCVWTGIECMTCVAGCSHRAAFAKAAPCIPCIGQRERARERERDFSLERRYHASVH